MFNNHFYQGVSDAEVTEEMAQSDEEGNLAHSLSNSGVMRV